MKKVLKLVLLSIIILTLVGCNKKEIEFTYSVDGKVTEIGDTIKIKVLRENEINYEYITINKENDIKLGDYITIIYKNINNGIVENYEYEINNTAEFTGTIESITENNAVIKVNENETYILNSADKVIVNISEYKELIVGDIIMIEFTGDFNESYPLQLEVVSIHEIIID